MPAKATSMSSSSRPVRLFPRFVFKRKPPLRFRVGQGARMLPRMFTCIIVVCYKHDPMKRLNVAMIGYRFMGKAHSNAWRQVGHFFALPCEPVMKVICGRDEDSVREAARAYG